MGDSSTMSVPAASSLTLKDIEYGTEDVDHLALEKTVHYLDAGRKYGKHESGGRYCCGFTFIMVMWFVVGALATFVVTFTIAATAKPVETTVSTDANATLASDDTMPVGGEFNQALQILVIMVPFLMCFLAIWIAARFIHGRPLRTVITGAPSISWIQILLGFIACSASLCIVTAVDFAMHNDLYQAPDIDLVPYLCVVAVCVTLLPIQTTAEELLCRGYFMQALTGIQRNIYYLCPLSGLLFCLLHVLNFIGSDIITAVTTLPYYFFLGLGFAYASCLAGGIELAIGAHYGNNLLNFLVLNYIRIGVDASGDPVGIPLAFLYGHAAVTGVFLIALGLYFRRRSARKMALQDLVSLDNSEQIIGSSYDEIVSKK